VPPAAIGAEGGHEQDRDRLGDQLRHDHQQARFDRDRGARRRGRGGRDRLPRCHPDQPDRPVLDLAPLRGAEFGAIAGILAEPQRVPRVGEHPPGRTGRRRRRRRGGQALALRRRGVDGSMAASAATARCASAAKARERASRRGTSTAAPRQGRAAAAAPVAGGTS
jgi:hypothetical protein